MIKNKAWPHCERICHRSILDDLTLLRGTTHFNLRFIFTTYDSTSVAVSCKVFHIYWYKKRVHLNLQWNLRHNLKHNTLIDYRKEQESMPQSHWAEHLLVAKCVGLGTFISWSSFIQWISNNTVFSEVTQLAEIAHEVIFYLNGLCFLE